MNLDITPNRGALALGCAFLAGGYYFGVTSADQGALALGCFGAGGVSLVASLVLFAKQEKEKERRRMDSFMRAVDNMPMDMPVPDPPLDCAPGQVGQAVLHPIEEDMEPAQPIIPQPTYEPSQGVQVAQAPQGQVLGQVQPVPTHQVPMQEMQPVAQVPVQEMPVQQYQEAPVQQPVQEMPVQQPVQEMPVQQPVQEMPVQQAVQEMPVQQYQEAPVAQVPVQEMPVQQPVQEMPVQQPVQEMPVQQPVQASPQGEFTPNPAHQARVRPSLEKARAEAEEIRAKAMAARNRQARPPVRQEQRFSPSVQGRPSLAEKMNAPEAPKSVPISELPSFNQEDWGVYEEKNIK